MDSQNTLVFERVVVFSPEPHCIFYPTDESIPAAVFLTFIQTHALDCNSSQSDAFDSQVSRYWKTRLSFP